MKFALATIISLSILVSYESTSAEDPGKAQWLAEQIRIGYIYSTRPIRLDGPLRTDNISDIEVREIELVMDEVYPGAIVNIGGVTSGCPCEDGLSCDSQVWVVANRANRSDGLMLSRIDGYWQVGPLQDWWLRYKKLTSLKFAALRDKGPDYLDTFSEFQERQSDLQLEFPSCSPDI